MRIAIVSDIHDNLTAFKAVLADLKETSPDLILHGGDLVHGGSSPVEIVDRVRDLGWPGVYGNTDEAVFRPGSIAEFASRRPANLQPMFAMIEEMAAFTRERLGAERIAWLAGLPRDLIEGSIGLVHAAPDSPWRSVGAEASDEELERVYSPLGKAMVVYGHIHQPFVRALERLTVVNSGSVGQPHDGDRRAAYALVDKGRPEIRRVEWDVERELRALGSSGLPHAGWIARILETGRPQMP